MSDYDQVKLFYSWGINIKPYVGLMISEDEYEEIIKKGE
ncbi:XkdX family protein [Lapidilactobacillus gannanensis]|uniref:XkdX family protein n=1 Tax=Lapidilactobacillus gannanensis TaxID=2486002 RepID=A0ABW4BMS7_9LACO|nr:XkdX family protein [Lapidilactobacillus gannanensis]